MANKLGILKSIGLWLAEHLVKHLIKGVEKKATPTIVNYTHNQILVVSQQFLDSPNPYDDALAKILCDIFGLELPERKE